MGSIESSPQEVVDSMFDGTKHREATAFEPQLATRVPELIQAASYAEQCLIVSLDYQTRADEIAREGIYPLATNVGHDAEVQLAKAESAAYVLDVVFPREDGGWLDVIRASTIVRLNATKEAYDAEVGFTN